MAFVAWAQCVAQVTESREYRAGNDEHIQMLV